MSDSILSLELRRSNLRPLPKKKDEFINGIRGRIIIPLTTKQKEDIINLRKESEAKAFKLETEPEPVNELLFQSQEAEDGFQQAEVELKKGNLFNNFTEATAQKEHDKIIKKLAQEEHDKIIKEQQERHIKYDKILNRGIIIYKKREVQRKKDKQESIRNSRTIEQIHANHTSRANHNDVLSGKTDGVAARRNLAETTHKAMSGENIHLFHSRYWDDDR
jgi:hypothetical protein